MSDADTGAMRDEELEAFRRAAYALVVWG